MTELPTLLSVLIIAILATVPFSTSQTLHCKPDDAGCQRCNRVCNAISPSFLPECCEAFNTCCDHYFVACKICDKISLTDKYFPEYCCASFTSCCDKVTTINVSPIAERPKNEAPRIGNVKESFVGNSESPTPSVPQEARSTPRLQGSTLRQQELQRVLSGDALPAAETFSKDQGKGRGRGRGSNKQRQRNSQTTETRTGTRRSSSPKSSDTTISMPNRRRVSSRGRVVEN